MEKVDMEGSETADSNVPFIEEEKYDKSGHSSGKKTLLVFFFLALSLIISLLSILLSVFNFAQLHIFSRPVETVDFSQLCVPCEELVYYPSQFDSDQLDTFSREKTTDGQDACCARNSQEFKKLIDSLVEKKIRKTHVIGCQPNIQDGSGNECKPKFRNNHTIAAHVLLANKEGGSVDQASLSPVKGWIANRSPSFVEKVILREDRLVVPTRGLYYIYSQISMVEYHDMKHRSNRDNSLIQHEIQRWNIFYPAEDTLLRHSQTKVRDYSESYTEYTSYVGGVMFLKAGDELFVTSSDTNLIQADGTQTYFGLYRL